MLVKKRWHLILVKENWENRVSKSLVKNKIEIYFPIASITRVNWLDKRNEVTIPLFPSHLFAYIDFQADYEQIKQTKGVLNFCYRLNEPAIITQEDIDAIKIFTSLYHNISFEKAYVPSLITEDKKALFLNKEFSEDSEYGSNKEKLLLPSLGFYISGEVTRKAETARVVRAESNTVSRRVLLYRNDGDINSEITVAS